MVNNTKEPDTEKRKYFKIEQSHTAPSSAAWSSDKVKRRRAEEHAQSVEEKRAQLTKRHIKRHPAFSKDTVSRALLRRQIGFSWGESGGIVRGFECQDVRAAAWAEGVMEKGSVPFVPSFARQRFANIPCFYVGGEDWKTGMGVAYATLDEETLVGSYISTDTNDRIISPQQGSVRMGRGNTYHTEMIRCPQMSSIKYHKPSHKMLLTSREPDHSCGLFFFSPPVSSEEDDRPQWLLGETTHYQRLFIRHRLRDEWFVHQSTPAPASSELLCVIGTNAGILRVRANGTLAWISAHGPLPNGSRLPRKQQQPQEVYDQDFQVGNHNVLFAGGRQPRLWTTDLRTSDGDWSFIPHASSIAHLRSVNEHQVLVAGLQNAMSLYDMRFCSGGQYRPNGSKPLLSFPEYQNEAHFHTGWDVSTDLGVVAAAHDDGTVKLFSLRSGSIQQSRGLAQGLARTDTPIKALMFQQMPHEKLPSLYVGEGPSLKKFSFGTRDLQYEE